MEGCVKELSQYRFQRAEEEFCTVGILLEAMQFKASINRSYYSIFHALRSVTALDNFDSGKHSGVIAYFNRHYIKEGVFTRSPGIPVGSHRGHLSLMFNRFKLLIG